MKEQAGAGSCGAVAAQRPLQHATPSLLCATGSVHAVREHPSGCGAGLTQAAPDTERARHGVHQHQERRPPPPPALPCVCAACGARRAQRSPGQRQTPRTNRSDQRLTPALRLEGRQVALRRSAFLASAGKAGLHWVCIMGCAAGRVQGVKSAAGTPGGGWVVVVVVRATVLRCSGAGASALFRRWRVAAATQHMHKMRSERWRGPLACSLRFCASRSAIACLSSATASSSLSPWAPAPGAGVDGSAGPAGFLSEAEALPVLSTMRVYSDCSPLTCAGGGVGAALADGRREVCFKRRGTLGCAAMATRRAAWQRCLRGMHPRLASCLHGRASRVQGGTGTSSAVSARTRPWCALIGWNLALAARSMAAHPQRAAGGSRPGLAAPRRGRPCAHVP